LPTDIVEIAGTAKEIDAKRNRLVRRLNQLQAPVLNQKISELFEKLLAPSP
jgi:hypothetical protein